MDFTDSRGVFSCKMVPQHFRKLCRVCSDWLAGIPSGGAVLANTGATHASDRSFCLKFILIFIHKGSAKIVLAPWIWIKSFWSNFLLISIEFNLDRIELIKIKDENYWINSTWFKSRVKILDQQHLIRIQGTKTIWKFIDLWIFPNFTSLFFMHYKL